MTLPLILTVPHTTAAERQLITQVVSSRSFDGIDPHHIIEVVRKYGAIEKSHEIASDYAQRARAAIESFPQSPAKEALNSALDVVLERDR